MHSFKNSNNSQRSTGFRAVIPFYILFDLELNANHLRLYGQIEQMESNPDPSISATFSYNWFASQLGINRRNTIKVAELLISKGYIEHVQISESKWIWRTVKKQVNHDINYSSPSVAERHPPVSLRDTGGVSLRDTQRSKKIKIKEDNNINPISLKKIYSISLPEILKDNRHAILPDLIQEWFVSRKKPITKRVWKKVNDVMDVLLQKQNIKPSEAFEYMLDKQWESMEVKYFSDYNNQSSKSNKNKKLSNCLDHNDTSWINDIEMDLF